VSLVGKFVFHCGAGYSHWGEVVDQIGTDIFLIRFDRQDKSIPPAGVMAFDVCDFVTELDHEGNPEAEWEFFDTRAELDKYVKWLFTETPKKHPKPVVVKLHS
jgi:hypothetical protein